MILSHIAIDWRDLPIHRLANIKGSGVYASHQWLWTLFPAAKRRAFLFRQEQSERGLLIYLLSATTPTQSPHDGLRILASKPFTPQLASGETLTFSLRVNPVITHQGKRADVLMNAKYHAESRLDTDAVWQRQQDAVKTWLQKQGASRGFTVKREQLQVTSYRQQRCAKPKAKKNIRFSSVDIDGCLKVTEPALFVEHLALGLGKSRALGCGLILIKRLQ